MTFDETLLRPPGDRFQVLALDGGGIRGIFTAALLDGLEATTGARLLDHFDLVVGTSTGGIIALALAAGFSPAEIVDVYVDEMRSIFPGPQALRRVRKLFRSSTRLRGSSGSLSDSSVIVCSATVRCRS